VKYLVDSDVLSDATKLNPSPQVSDWLLSHSADLVVNPIILGEIEYGIFILPASRKRKQLLDWFATGIQQINVVAIDNQTASVWAGLLNDLKRKGRAMPVKDSLIAASAKQYGLTIATRNTNDYQNAGVAIFDPFEG
jgi:predicted nucleic acid-binding protein